MGNWRHRPRRRFYRCNDDYIPKYPPSYHRPESSFSEYCNDGVPLWEKKFCSLIGLVSWRKIVDAKKFKCYNDNVLKWNDSAGEEAFQNAKKRYWAKINDLPCDISSSDPDAYVDQINWNPFIDHELVRDIEQAYFAPNNEEKDGKLGHEEKTSEGCNMNPDNPWESNNGIQGNNGLGDLISWGQLVSKAEDSRNLSDKGNNPWENSIIRENECGKHNSWGDYSSRDWNTGNNSWGHSCQGICSKNNDGWRDFKQNSWGRYQWDTKKFPHRDHSWDHSFLQHDGAPNNQRSTDCGRNSWGWKRWENPNIESRNLDFKQTSGGRVWHSGSRKREGSQQYISGKKCSRFQRDDYETIHCWSGEPNKKG